MKKVVIMLSTYNGEKYLDEQLNSLVNQTYKNIEILIRDDESKDNTIKIIEEYKKKYKNIKLIKGKNVGFINSFIQLLKTAKGDYYSYCDQDDVWYLDKIEKAVCLLEKENKDIPLLYVSNYDYYDENMTFISHHIAFKIEPSFSNALLENIAPGMTMVLNQKARDEIIKMNHEKIMYHDWWTYLVCVSLGKVIYDNNVTVKYRRHSNNVTTIEYGFIKLFIFRLKEYLFNNKFWNKLIEQHLLFYNMYVDRIDNDNKKILKLFVNKRNFFNQIKKVFYPIRFRNSLSQELMIRTMFLIWKI